MGNNVFKSYINVLRAVVLRLKLKVTIDFFSIFKPRYKSIIGDYNITDEDAKKIWGKTCQKSIFNPCSLFFLIIGALINLHFLKPKPDIMLFDFISVKNVIIYTYVYIYLVLVESIRIKKFREAIQDKKINKG